MLDALLHILVCLEQKRNVPVWMEDQKEHYLINAVHAAKDRIKELCSHENESNKLKFELVQCFFISCFLAKEYSQYQEIDWINDYANNNIKRALARLDDIENSGSEIDVFQSTLIKSLIENTEIPSLHSDSLREQFSDVQHSNPVILNNELAIASLYFYSGENYANLEGRIDFNIINFFKLFKSISCVSNERAVLEQSGGSYFIELFKSDYATLFKNTNLVLSFIKTKVKKERDDAKVLDIQLNENIYDFSDEIFSLHGVENTTSRLGSNILKNLKNRTKNSELLVIRPHMLAGKSNLFDIEYLTACIEAICQFEKNKTVVFIVNEPSYFKKLSFDNLFILSFTDLAVEDFYEFTKLYKHLSTNHLEFEQFSISSYFLINSLVKLLELDSCYIVEGDTLLLRDISSFDSLLPDVYLSNLNTCCFAKVSRELLQHYCATALKVYKTPRILEVLEEEHRRRQELGHKGGFNDMTVWQIIANNRFGAGSHIEWGRCDLLVNGSICDHFYHKTDKAYLDSRGVSESLLKTTIDTTHNKENISLEGKKIKVLKQGENIEVYYVTQSAQEIRVNTVQFGGHYKIAMVHIWRAIKTLKEGVLYV